MCGSAGHRITIQDPGASFEGADRIRPAAEQHVPDSGRIGLPDSAKLHGNNGAQSAELGSDGVVDRGLPLALVHTPQTFLPAADKFVKKTGFAMQQFFGRVYRAVQLPAEMDRADLIAVARIHFPELGDEYLEV